MLSDCCLSVGLPCPVLSVCNVGVLWPNGWRDQDETWRGGRPRPWPHCVRWGPSSLPKGAQPPNFQPICCGQTAEWIKMPLSREVGLGPGDLVLDGDPAPPPRGTAPQFSVHVYCGETVAHLSYCWALVKNYFAFIKWRKRVCWHFNGLRWEWLGGCVALK